MERLHIMYDLVIIGSGPAGLTAAIYMARARYRVLVVEKENTGGQITITSEVVNYPGIISISGRELTANMKTQAENFGAEFTGDQITDIVRNDDGTFVVKGKGRDYRSLSVIIATGAHPRKIGFRGEHEFQGRGVAYCATCDGEFFTGRDVFVIGGGFAAVEEAIFLTRYARSVTINVRKARFSCAQSVVDELKKYDKIKVNFNTEVVEVSGDGILQKAVFQNNQTGEQTVFEAGNGDMFGVFVFAGYEPETQWLKNGSSGVALREDGYIVTDRERRTNIEGIYAAGDVCVKELRQVVTAVADGAIAATGAEKYAARLHDVLNIPQFEIKRTERKPEKTETAETASKTEEPVGDPGEFITPQLRAQLLPLFDKFSSPVIIRAETCSSELGREISGFVREFENIHSKIRIQVEEHEGSQNSADIPVIKILTDVGKETGLDFHAVPGGHEFNSFVIGLYNVAGPGQKIEDHDFAGIQNIGSEKDVKIFVSLSCTMCPETVMSAQRIASLSDKVRVGVYDLQHFPEFRDKYRIMSVPCIVINDQSPQFGKKNITQFLELLK